MLYFSNLLQHARRGEVATQDFLGMLCVAKLSQKSGRDPAGLFLVPESPHGNERSQEAKMAVDELAAILAFFGVDPKKVPLVFGSAPPAEYGNASPLAPRPQGGRGEGLRRVSGKP